MGLFLRYDIPHKKNSIFVIINKLLPMKNLKKLTKRELKNINGGNAPDCPEGTTPCYIPGSNGFPSRWKCILDTMECP
ncbi:hypothetical protein DRF59_07060 [Chryseobacterium flavum]|uniref:Bacteriocin n=2 Tax=Chryseobacterium flavum TaxID=415851 RepID=A0A3D9CQM2_9FLAO|nr:hypothetical protein DRF59_07060 [Chryseobacterium flavum]